MRTHSHTYQAGFRQTSAAPTHRSLLQLPSRHLNTGIAHQPTCTRDVSAAVQVLGCVPLARERRLVRVSWLPRPNVLSMEVALSPSSSGAPVFRPLGLVLHPEVPDVELMRLGTCTDAWLPARSSLERVLIGTAQAMKHSYERDVNSVAMS